MSAIRIQASAAVLSPLGRSGIAVIRVWGPDAVAVADSAFRPYGGKPLRDSGLNRIRVGRIGAAPGDEAAAVLIARGVGIGVGIGADQTIEAEIQCHGGPEPVRLVLDALAEAGATIRTAEDWVRAANVSAIRAQAEIDLACAPTLRVAEILLEQAQGAWDREIEAWLKLDDPNALSVALDQWLDRAATGVRIRQGWRLALAGRPNVGKSQLLNALAGYPRAIVSATPGATRDVVSIEAAFEGWPATVSDTAGLRDQADDPLEAAGIGLALAAHEAADLVVLVLDRSEPLSEADRDLLDRHQGGLIVANKMDLPARWPVWEGVFEVSARRGDGVLALTKAMAARLVPDPPEPGVGVPFRREHVQALREARELCDAGRSVEAKGVMASLLDGEG